MQKHVCILTKGFRGGFCSPTDLAGSSQVGLEPPLSDPRSLPLPFLWEGGSDVSSACRVAQAQGRFKGMAFLPAAGSQQAECPPDHVHFALPSNTLLFVNCHGSSTHFPLSGLISSCPGILAHHCKAYIYTQCPCEASPTLASIMPISSIAPSRNLLLNISSAHSHLLAFLQTLQKSIESCS